MNVAMKKITLIITNSNNIKNFRYNLILRLKEEYNVSVIAFDNEAKKDAEELGIGFYSVNADNRSTSIVQNLSITDRIASILKQIHPDKVMTFQLKPNTFGVFAAKKAAIKDVYSMVEGAGDVFINTGVKWKTIRIIVCTLYREAFKYSKKVIFLNNDDKNEFIDRKLVDADKCIVIPGIGVDLEKFSFKPVKNYRTFLMIARMLKTKGVIEYCEVARQVKKKYPDAVFNYLGAEGTLKLSDIQEYIDDGSINYLGVTNDVRPYLEECSLLLLSSYREGLPMSIMEAEATGRAIITTNNIGCRDSVANNFNGFVCKCEIGVGGGLHDISDLSNIIQKVEYFILNPDKISEFGRNSRLFAEENFDQKKINNKIINLLNS